MPALTRVVTPIFRIGELVFSSVTAGIAGSYLHHLDKQSAWPEKRFIYTEVIAGVSILVSLFWLLPVAAGFYGWPLDLLLATAWIAAFALLVDQLEEQHCGRTFDWSGITNRGVCSRWKAAEVFSFLGAIFWLVTTAIGIWIVSRSRRERAGVTNSADTSRHRWYHASHV